jgi:CubicO group peptidase (beta-lactamase class C family)
MSVSNNPLYHEGGMTKVRRIIHITGAAVFLLLSWFPQTRAQAATDLAGDVSDTTQLTAIADKIVAAVRSGAPKWFSESGVPGMAIAVVNHQGVLWKGEYGFTTRERTTVINSHTLFSLQSISKNITGLTALMAVQDGLLDIDAPISDYLPEFTVKSRFEQHPEQRITLRHLLSHWSGLTHDAPVGSYFDNSIHSFEDHITSISDTWLRYPVGYCFAYSSPGIDLAGYIVQRVSGQPFEEYVKQKIFLPLGMSNSTFDMDVIRASSNCAHGHDEDSSHSWTRPPMPIPMMPAGGCYSNIEDMAKLVQFHINRGLVRGEQLLSRTLIEQMNTIAFPCQHQRSGYGLCLEVETISGDVHRLFHTGSGWGFRSAMYVYPDLDVGLVLLYNSHEISVRNDCESAVEAVVNAAVDKGSNVDIDGMVAGLVPLEAEDPRISSILGTYVPYFRIEVEADQLLVSTERGSGELDVYSRDGIHLEGVIPGRHFLQFLPALDKSQKGSIRFLTFAGTTMPYDYHKPLDVGDEPGPNKPRWKEYVGKYHAYTWVREDKRLFEVSVVDGYMCIDSLRCHEHLPGLFFTPDGQTLDLRGDRPVYMNIRLMK